MKNKKKNAETYHIEFPCNYPIKIIGTFDDDFQEHVCRLTSIHAPGFTDKDVTVHMSGKGNYCSVNITITATGEDQLKALHKELMGHSLVKMVL
jgi:putative lipoic acid-binding regulatory protein